MDLVLRKYLVIVASIASLTLFSSAIVGQPDELQKLLGDARAAVGRESDLARVRSLSVTADCVGPKGSYTTFIDSFRVSKTRFAQTFTYKDAPLTVLANGETAWTIDSRTGDATLSSPFMRMAARAHEYQKMAFEVGSFFTGLKIAGSTEFEGRQSVRVSSRNELGMPVDLYFDKETKRLNGYVLSIPDSTETIKNVFLEWQKVGRLMLPTVVRATDKEGDWPLRFSSIGLNKANEKLLDIPPRIADMAEILRMHEVQKTAHLTYDAELLLGDSRETPLSIQRGNVVKRTREEDLARLRHIFRPLSSWNGKT